MKAAPKITIAIPARYGSARFPGKPLAEIAGRTMLGRVVDLAREAAKGFKDVDIFVATEDRSIAQHASELEVDCYMTPESCPTGSDRVLAAIDKLEEKPDFVINLQGDAPFTPPEVIKDLITTIIDNPELEVVTPAHQLRWEDLDRLREAKKTTPFSGTTCIRSKDGFAIWFSKNIVPAIRDEDKWRAETKKSPVWQHMGIYGFRIDILEKFARELAQGQYEIFEGLEQLRLLENDITIYVADIDAPKGIIQSGIDTPEDIERAEKLLATP